MKIAILSDIHDNIPNLDKALAEVKKQKIKTIIFCGDLCASSTLTKLAKISAKIHITFGNVDGDEYMITKLTEEKFKNVTLHEELGEIKIGGKKIAFCHLPKFAYGLASSGKYDLVFYGHTHTPWKEKVKKTILLNPGEIGSHFGKASFAIYNLKNNKTELKILK